MNTVNHALTAVFDALLWPLERLGPAAALVISSAIFGVLALFVFKHISFQRRIRAVKDKIQAHLIEVRIYQDDARVASKAIGKVLLRNLQYIGLNLLPFVPLALPFTLIVAQLVVRFGYAPVPLTPPDARVLSGAGTLIEVELERDRAELAAGLRLELPEGVVALSPLVRLASQGKAWQEVVVRKPGALDLVVALPDGSRETKRLVAGVPARSMQPARGKGLGHALLWPAEDGFGASSPFVSITARPPDSQLGWLPGGPSGVVLVFLLASLAGGALAIKPLKVQI